MMTGREAFLTHILDCGTADLSLLDGVNYDWNDIMWEPFENLDFCNVMYAVFQYGFGEIENAVNERIRELEVIASERLLDNTEEKELSKLRGLSPRDDFTSYHNYLDTHVYCEKHGRTYIEYMSEALEEFEENTGFNIEYSYV